MERQQGVVKWFATDKGYGFIRGNGGRDVFVHAKSLKGLTINQGDLIEFTPVEVKKGLAAEEVEMIEQGYESVERRDSTRTHRRDRETTRGY